MIALVRPGTTIAVGYREPLSLEYLAAYLEREGIPVCIIDGATTNVYRELERIKPKFIGISIMTPDVPCAMEISDWARKRGIQVIVGGIHATMSPEETLGWADHVVIGDGERALVDIVSGKKSGIAHGETMDISFLPPPARHLVDYEYYVTRYVVGERTAAIMTSRGCPFHCSYCWNSLHSEKPRYNSVENVISEVNDVVKRYNIKRVFFQDDNLLVPVSRFKAIMDGIKGVKVEALTRATSVTDDVVKYGMERGLDMIDIGFESASQRVLDNLNKQIKVESYQRAMDVCARNGLKVNATFMVGNPGETMEDIELTRQFIARNKFYQVGVNYLIPYPGTKLWNDSKVTDTSWGKYQPNANSVPVNVSGTMTDDEVVKAYNILHGAVPTVNITIRWLLGTIMSNPSLAVKQLIKDRRRIGRFIKRLRF